MMLPICPVCKGRGEVEAGITGGFVKTGETDEYGATGGHPTWVRPNPNAVDKQGRIWFLDINPLVLLWSTAVCQPCNGTGMDMKEILGK